MTHADHEFLATLETQQNKDFLPYEFDLWKDVLRIKQWQSMRKSGYTPAQIADWLAA